MLLNSNLSMWIVYSKLKNVSSTHGNPLIATVYKSPLNPLQCLSISLYTLIFTSPN